MPIQSAIPVGEFVKVFNERNQQIFSIPMGTDPEDGIVSSSSTAVTVRMGNSIRTYNERGQMIQSVQVSRRQESRPANYAPSATPALAITPSHRTDEAPSKLFPLMAIAALAIAVFSPGLIAVAAVKNLLSLSLETGQVWTFGIACSAVVWAAFYLANRDFRKASGRYLVLCAIVLVLFLFCHFGLKTEFTQQMLKLYFPQH
jgi:hypothetical protein